MSPSKGNGWRAWVISALLLLCSGLAAWAWGSMDSRVTKTEAYGERIRANETDVTNIKSSLERIENKVDRLLER